MPRIGLDSRGEFLFQLLFNLRLLSCDLLLEFRTYSFGKGSHNVGFLFLLGFDSRRVAPYFDLSEDIISLNVQSGRLAVIRRLNDDFLQDFSGHLGLKVLPLFLNFGFFVPEARHVLDFVLVVGVVGELGLAQQILVFIRVEFGSHRFERGDFSILHAAYFDLAGPISV